jgi:hypothetical protein
VQIFTHSYAELSCQANDDTNRQAKDDVGTVLLYQVEQWESEVNWKEDISSID